MIDDIFISGDDLKRIYQKKKKKIWRSAALGALLMLGYLIFTPPSYQATATFKQSSSRSGAGFDLKKLVSTFSGTGSEVATVPLMLSRAVLTKTVEELGLQAVVTHQGSLAKKISACRSNILAELGKQVEQEQWFQFQNVIYGGEKPQTFFIRFSSLQNFELLDGSQKFLTAGIVNEPVESQGTLLTLIKTPPKLQMGKLYSLTMLPLRSVIDHVKSRTRIKPLREDKNILMINFSDPDRERSAQFVNTLVSKYEEFLKEENKAVIGSQLKYLNQRQNELSSKLDVDIQDHVAVLKKAF